ncbi:MAG: FAD-binding oxidoreductase [Chloroflexales bacterium]|nr:FAD-binding oxidoreductase [Chloroflexales bacterium]
MTIDRSREGNRSYWQETFDLNMPSAPLPARATHVVVGGGIVGSAAAYFLAKAGHKVVLIERIHPAHGATGRNGGFIGTGPAEGYSGAKARLGAAAAQQIYELTVQNGKLARQIMAEEGFDCHFREPGTFNLSLSPADHQAAKRGVAALNADGYSGQLLDRAQLQAMINTPLGEEVVGASYKPESALIHSGRLVRGVVEAAITHGATLCIATVARIDYSNGDPIVVTDKGNIQAQSVVLGLNAWSVFSQGMGTDITPTGEYWQQTLDGSIVLGGCRAIAANKDVNLYDIGITDDVQGALDNVLPRLFPKLTGLPITRRWAGLMGFTPDYVPVVDAMPGMHGVWAGGGFCGSPRGEFYGLFD